MLLSRMGNADYTNSLIDAIAAALVAAENGDESGLPDALKCARMLRAAQVDYAPELFASIQIQRNRRERAERKKAA